MKYKLGDIVEKRKTEKYSKLYKITEIIPLDAGDGETRYVITSIPKTPGVNLLEKKDLGDGGCLFILPVRETVVESEIKPYSQKQTFTPEDE